MANYVLARAISLTADDDYHSFCDAVGASERGRAFLQEYARRNRHADTGVVLAALARLEETARAQQAAPEAERIRQDLRALLDTLRAARPQIDNSPGAIKAATLASLIDFVQARIEALILPVRATLTEVPPPEQPELPMPRPAQMPAVLALVQAAMAAPAPTTRSPLALLEPAPVEAPPAAIVWPQPSQIIPEVNFFDIASASAPKTETATAQKPKAAIVAEPNELWLDPDLLAPAPNPVPKPAPFKEAAPKADIKTKPVTAIAALAASIAAPKPVDAIAAPPVKAKAAIAALTAFAAKFERPAPAAAVQTAATTAPAQAATDKAADPLALIMGMSEAERLALFT
ncbi:MAG TPA: hypothetical protein VFC54_05155 [Pseudolabrys sp.]|nr:hypothetical protein [Pseudolabrys sp.]